ncbi:hypothetical protein T4E_5481 [Trichinella pseudospiralis]|uniref:PiggyBac transposable element-derived protein domain-containing protein n=1 Tax=Trichinella pseudospiralis TaxID=6337 RepID=A0A0V0XPC7_TRIPS|nr:hypothetical protein T4E_5481 [Trichinella pseudospiralis]
MINVGYFCLPHSVSLNWERLRQGETISQFKIGTVFALRRYRMFWANSSRVDSVADCTSLNKFEALLRFLHFNDSDKAIMDRI